MKNALMIIRFIMLLFMGWLNILIKRFKFLINVVYFLIENNILASGEFLKNDTRQIILKRASLTGYPNKVFEIYKDS